MSISILSPPGAQHCIHGDAVGGAHRALSGPVLVDHSWSGKSGWPNLARLYPAEWTCEIHFCKNEVARDVTEVTQAPWWLCDLFGPKEVTYDEVFVTNKSSLPHQEGPLGTRIRQEKSPLSHGRKKRKTFDRNLPKLASEIQTCSVVKQRWNLSMPSLPAAV